MDDHHPHSIPPPLTAAASWPFFWEDQEGDAEEAAELKQALLRTTLELDATRLMAQDELRRMEAQATHLAHLLDVATRERDEARHQCRSLLHLLKPTTNPVTPNSGPNPVQPSSVDETSHLAAASSSSEDESSNVSSPPAVAAVEAAAERRGLPEKGRLVEAVMGAGPLLQTLMLAGPLPRWRHPPPAMQSFDIPPVVVAGNSSNGGVNADEQKREREEGDVLLFQPAAVSRTPSPELSSGSRSYQKIGPFRV